MPSPRRTLPDRCTHQIKVAEIPPTRSGCRGPMSCAPDDGHSRERSCKHRALDRQGAMMVGPHPLVPLNSPALAPHEGRYETSVGKRGSSALLGLGSSSRGFIRAATTFRAQPRSHSVPVAHPATHHAHVTNQVWTVATEKTNVVLAAGSGDRSAVSRQWKCRSCGYSPRCRHSSHRGSEPQSNLILASHAASKVLRAMEEDPLVVAAFSAARAGRVEELDAMLEAHPDLIERRSDVNHHHTLLIIAAWHGRTGVTLSLIERGAQVNAINDEGRTALWFASCGGHLEVVRLLMAHAADPSVRKEGGSTALMAAAWTGHVEVAAYILNKAEDPSKLVSEKNRDGCGALWFAAAHGKLALVKLLLQRGADVLTGDIDGFQPSKVARLRNHVDCAELLENAERAYIVHLHRTLYDDTCTLTNLPRGSTRSRTVEKRQRMTPWYLKARTDRNRPFPEADTLRSKKRNSQTEMLEETAAFVVKELKKELVAELLQMFSYPV